MTLLDRVRQQVSKFKIDGDRAILLVCMGIALFLWLLVKLSKSYTTEKEVNLFFFLPPETAYAEYPPEKCSLDIRGTEWDLMYDYFINPEINLYYDLTKVQNLNFDNRRLRNDIIDEFTSRDISIDKFNYDGFEVQLEGKVEKKLPIQLVHFLEFSPEYHLKGHIQLTPDSVLVSGPVTIISELNHWKTDSLVLKNIKTDVVKTVNLIQPPKEVNLGSLRTSVEIQVEQFTEKSFFVPVVVKNAPDSLKIFPEQIMLTCIVGLSQYNKVNPDDFTLEVDLRQASISNKENTVPIVLTTYPSFVKNVYFSPKSAQYFIVELTDNGKAP